MMRRNNSRGSITLEASIFVPMFIMLMLLVNGLFIMFMGQQIMTNALVQSAKSLAFDPYATERVSEAECGSLMEMFSDFFNLFTDDYISSEKWYAEDGNVEEEVANRFLKYLRKEEDDAEKLLELVGVENGANGLDFSESKVEDDTLTVSVKYKQEFVFNTFGMASFDRNMSVQVKLFTYNTIG